MKTQRLNPARKTVITEALVDYLEQCFEEKEEGEEVSFLVHKHFEEFVHWAYDDILISSEERNILLNSRERELHKHLKAEAAKSFSMAIYT